MIVCLLALCGAAPVDFARDVRPILNRRCVACHGGVRQAGGISFIYRDQVFGEADSGERPVVPGDPDLSELLVRVTSGDESLRMPPPEEHPQGLTADEIGTLRRWIEQGAPWGSHWAFEPPTRHQPPTVENAAWPRQPIDRFVLSRLETAGLQPSDAAEPDRWLRRVSLDLTGLPPTPEQRADFLHSLDRGEVAYEAAVDRLLASPHFGERWASVWLDQVRYADSRGLGADGRRSIWKYRDWVIDALDADMPFDRFTELQIAGDLLPGAGVAETLPTAVHRLTQTNEEGGTDDEEFRVAAVIDRMSTVWQAWQGVTFGCAQCHSHPYEPIRHDEFYRFMALLNDTADCDLNDDAPHLAVPKDPADVPMADRLDRDVAASRRSLWNREYGVLMDPSVWREVGAMTAETDRDTGVAVRPGLFGPEFRTTSHVERDTTLTLEFAPPADLPLLTGVRFTGLPPDLAAARRDSVWGFVLSHAKLELVTDGGAAELALARVVADEPEPIQEPMRTLNAKSAQGYGPYTRQYDPRSCVLVLEEPAELKAGARLRLTLRQNVFLYAAFPQVTRRGRVHVSGDARLSALIDDPKIIADRKRLAGLVKQRRKIPSVNTPVLVRRPPHLSRQTRRFGRGSFLDKQELVTAGVPQSLAGERPVTDRLALADWLTSAENPLTARVAVNRFWSRLFGVGLVATEEDFGTSGDEPSHPLLLDDLAVRFRTDMRWSVKRLLRELVLSATYRQSGRRRDDAVAVDPANRLLARGPRVRLPAETLRDQALAVSGLLEPGLHGPPTFPPLPPGVWQPFANDKWVTPAVGEPGRYRRSIYTYRKRSIPFPTFTTFDAPSREECTPRRLRSNTPLQALTTLNDTTFREAAVALGVLMRDGEGDDRGRLRAGFVRATCREPASDELDALATLLDGADSGWTAAATVLLNLDETFVR